jgi:hypothetical protein
MKKQKDSAKAPAAKKANKKAVKGTVCDEWGEDAARLFGEIYRGEHEGNTIVSLFHRLDLPYNKYSEGSWNRHHNKIKRRVEIYKHDGTGRVWRMILSATLYLGLTASKSLALLTLRLSLGLRQQLQEKESDKQKQKKA